MANRPPLTERELVDPLTFPNPWIKKLLDIKLEISRETGEDPPSELTYEYAMAQEQILAAITSLFKAKNILAGDHVSDGIGGSDADNPVPFV